MATKTKRTGDKLRKWRAGGRLGFEFEHRVGGIPKEEAREIAVEAGYLDGRVLASWERWGWIAEEGDRYVATDELRNWRTLDGTEGMPGN